MPVNPPRKSLLCQLNLHHKWVRFRNPQQRVLKDIREAVSDRGRGVRSRGERPPTRGAPNHRR
jgi:hypothetical protein